MSLSDQITLELVEAREKLCSFLIEIRAINLKWDLEIENLKEQINKLEWKLLSAQADEKKTKNK